MSVSFVMLAISMGVSGAEFLPLAPGNRWTYQDASSGQSFTIEVEANQFYLNQNVGYTVMLTSFEAVPVRTGLTPAAGNTRSWAKLRSSVSGTTVLRAGGARVRSGTCPLPVPMPATYLNSSRRTSAWCNV